MMGNALSMIRRCGAHQVQETKPVRTARTWREYAAPIIAQTIRSVGGDADRAFLLKCLRAEYPFGERKRWPYKVWLSEIHRQLKDRSATRDRSATPNSRQAELFP